ncbi:tripartite tricarboxylate transporter substrate binding protein [Limnohabitans sp. DM1]|uniref:Bug family tripartite tricarboxylate transporter substrate binding protein n=1 Tax=Limnohabitans sp. DM1 TaxID=1597955 RepID=UPI000ABA3E9D|nr:tripartite tricarboxylate transporter substrate-binding protein [Limnohabitans sp. DM1]
MLNRRTFTVFSAAATMGAPALAQSDPLRIVVGFPAGGVVDIIARELAEAMKPHLGGRAVVVDAKPGAGGRIGVATVKTAPPDGNTVLLTPASIMTLYPHVFSKLAYDTQKDFVPISPVCMSANALAVGTHVPVKTLGEFLAWCKANPKDATYASPGAGSAPHFLGAQIASAAGIEMLHVPYKGAPDILNDLYGGRISSFVTALSNAAQPHKAGKMRVLVTTSPKRSAVLPDVQTAAEAGFPQLTSLEWFGLLAPAGISPERIAALNSAVSKAVASDRIKEAFGKLVMEPASTPSAEFARMIKADVDRWGETAKRMNYQPVDA